MCVNSAFRRLRQEDCLKFEARLGYTVSSRSAWTYIFLRRPEFDT